MKRAFTFGRVGMIIVSVMCAATQLAASHPDILRNYRFIPSRSTLDVSGGFAGIHETFHAFGKFALVTGYEDGVSCAAIGCPPPHHIPFARFEDVRSWLVPESPLAYVWDTDHTLNLSGLEGTFTDPRHLFFRGEDGQGAPFRLEATIRGRLIHLVGANDPPCCDFFEYKFNALAHLAPFADFNLDGQVDRVDLDTVMAHIGTTASATFDEGDADGDGDVDGNDFLVWQRQFGPATDFAELADAMALAAGPLAVPEPATIASVLASMLLLASRQLKSQSGR